MDNEADGVTPDHVPDDRCVVCLGHVRAKDAVWQCVQCYVLLHLSKFWLFVAF